jgi:hypothetical protein
LADRAEAEKKLAGQAKQTVWPGWGWYSPAKQFSQAVALEADWYSPERQSVQDRDASAAEKRPGAQTSQKDEFR